MPFPKQSIVSPFFSFFLSWDPHWEVFHGGIDHGIARESQKQSETSTEGGEEWRSRKNQEFLLNHESLSRAINKGQKSSVGYIVVIITCRKNILIHQGLIDRCHINQRMTYLKSEYMHICLNLMGLLCPTCTDNGYIAIAKGWISMGRCENQSNPKCICNTNALILEVL